MHKTSQTISHDNVKRIPSHNIAFGLPFSQLVPIELSNQPKTWFCSDSERLLYLLAINLFNISYLNFSLICEGKRKKKLSCIQYSYAQQCLSPPPAFFSHAIRRNEYGCTSIYLMSCMKQWIRLYKYLMLFVFIHSQNQYCTYLAR